MLGDVGAVHPLHIGEDDAAIFHLGDGDTVLDARAESLDPPQRCAGVDQVRIALADQSIGVCDLRNRLPTGGSANDGDSLGRLPEPGHPRRAIGHHHDLARLFLPLHVAGRDSALTQAQGGDDASGIFFGERAGSGEARNQNGTQTKSRCDAFACSHGSSPKAPMNGVSGMDGRTLPTKRIALRPNSEKRRRGAPGAKPIVPRLFPTGSRSSSNPTRRQIRYSDRL